MKHNDFRNDKFDNSITELNEIYNSGNLIMYRIQLFKVIFKTVRKTKLTIIVRLILKEAEGQHDDMGTDCSSILHVFLIKRRKASAEISDIQYRSLVME